MPTPQRQRGLFGQRDKRRHRRRTGRPLEVWFGNQRYYTLDWSRGGLCINTRRVVVRRGEVVTGYIGDLNARRLSRFAAVVARVADNGDVGLRLLRRVRAALPHPLTP